MPLLPTCVCFSKTKQKILCLRLDLLCFVPRRCWSVGRSGTQTYYNRADVLVYPLGPFTSVPADATGSSEAEENSLIPTAPAPLASISELAQPIEAQTYVWCRDDNELETELWSFDDFVRESAGRWVGSGAEDNEAYLEVDKARERDNNHKTASDEA
jgi:hypothetical protein